MAADFLNVGLGHGDDHEGGPSTIEIDTILPPSLERTLHTIGRDHGHKITAAIRLVAVFHFSGKASPLCIKGKGKAEALIAEGTACKGG